jgi:hypothetical protein
MVNDNVQGGFTFSDFVADVFAVFMFVLWFWLFMIIAGVLFRRQQDFQNS